MQRTPSKRSGPMLLPLAIAALLIPLSAAAYDSRSDDKDKSMTKQAKELREQAADAAGDLRIHLEIEAEFARSDELSALDLGTDVSDGVVRLQGEVDSDAQKALATELAKSVDGVKSVRNELTVAGGDATVAERIQQAAGEVALSTRVKTRLLASDNTSGLAISVSSEGDQVTLSGEVDSSTERELAETIARNTSGVASVRNDIAVADNY